MNQLCLILHAIINISIVVRIITYYPTTGSRRNLPASVMAYALCFAAGSVAIRILTGTYLVPVDPAEVFFNGLVLLALIAVRGNVSALIKPFQHGGREHGCIKTR